MSTDLAAEVSDHPFVRSLVGPSPLGPTRADRPDGNQADTQAQPTSDNGHHETRATGRTCRCGHPHAAHEHYRPGTECAACAAGDCLRYRPTSRWARLFRRGT